LRSELFAISKHYRLGQSAGHADVLLDLCDALECVVDFFNLTSMTSMADCGKENADLTKREDVAG